LLEQLADLPKAEADALIRAMAPGAAAAFEYHWRYRARPEQLPPGGSWRVWLLLAGRGFGKTRCGAEWVRAEVKAGRRRIALVGPTAADARDVMVEGEAGILAISPDHERPLYEPSKRRLTWRNGAVATLFSADEPERLRGPQHDAAWCDELGAWRYPEAWDMLMFGMRLGADPRTVVTTTPRPAIVIPMLNEAAGLPRLLRSLAALEPPPAEVLAVDGGSNVPSLIRDLVRDPRTSGRPGALARAAGVSRKR
jgi:phage terminase large subunit-like protein